MPLLSNCPALLPASPRRCPLLPPFLTSGRQMTKECWRVQSQSQCRHSTPARVVLMPSMTTNLICQATDAQARDLRRHAGCTASLLQSLCPVLHGSSDSLASLQPSRANAGRLRLITHSAPVSRVCCCIFLSSRRWPLVPHCKKPKPACIQFQNRTTNHKHPQSTTKNTGVIRANVAVHG